jgi:hypothetical protein
MYIAVLETKPALSSAQLLSSWPDVGTTTD